MEIDFLNVECPEAVEGLHFVYILNCGNGSLFVGQTSDVGARLLEHREGTGSGDSRVIRLFRLVFAEGPMAEELAVERQRQLRKLSHAQKVAFIFSQTMQLPKRVLPSVEALGA